MSHWYSSGFFWTVAAGIGTLLGVTLTLLTLVVPWILSRRVITYELLTAAPLIHMPMDVNPDLRVTHHGVTLKDPHIVVARLSYRGRRDLPSSAFDQGHPVHLDVGTKIVALLRTVFTPSKAPVPTANINDSIIEIGPSLIRRNLKMEFVILVDGSNVKLDCYGPLADVKFRSEQSE
jgi:hypothetical protein